MLTQEGSENRFEGIDAAMVGIVRGKARDLARRPEFNPHELEDLEQELMLEVLQALAGHDQGKASLKTYLRRIVDHKAARLLKSRRAQKRAGGMEAVSLEAILEENADGDSLDESFIDPRPSPDMAVAFALDVEVVLTKLSAGEREICNRLRSQTVSEVAKGGEMSRSAIYRSIGQIRNFFTNAGLDDF